MKRLLLFISLSLAQDVPQPPGPGTQDPASAPYKACKYDEPAWSDCDPFNVARWRNRKLVSGIGCELYKNETRHCGPDDFPPATKWLIEEHKKCLSQLEHLKNAIGDLHRWIDLIRERGEAVYKAFNDLRRRLEDIRGRIKELHRQNHEAEQLVVRLKKELAEWQERCRKIKVELEEVKTFYVKLEKEHAKMSKDFDAVRAFNAGCKRDQKALSKRVSQMAAENRELKGRLLDAERFKEAVSVVARKRNELLDGVRGLAKEIVKTKVDLQKCKIDLMNAKNRKPATYNKDTHVNLDMQMWITHNQTKDAYDEIKKDDRKYNVEYTTSAYDNMRYNVDMQNRQSQNYLNVKKVQSQGAKVMPTTRGPQKPQRVLAAYTKQG